MVKRVLFGSGTLLGALGLFAAPGAQALTVSQVVTHAPMIRATAPTTGHGHHGTGSNGKPGGGGSTPTFGWESSNWSGYAVTGNTYNSITGNWTVPAVQPSGKPQYSSTWIGIDGFNNSNLIQTGTEQDTSGGATQYYAWWEILPASETQITTSSGALEPVSPGDKMTASITNDGGGNWTITISDGTKWSFTTNQSYTGPATSAEWIEEAPTIGGHVATLANYGQATIDPGTINGVSPAFTASEDGAMVQHNSLVSVPSLPDTPNADGFNVAYGSTQPAAPSNS